MGPRTILSSRAVTYGNGGKHWMTVVTPEEIMNEFKQFLKKTRLDEKAKTTEEKESMVMKQIKKLLGD